MIDPHGNVHRSLPPMEEGVLTYRIGRNGHKTIFTQVGWLFPWLAIGGSVILFVHMGIKHVVGRQRKAHPEDRQLSSEALRRTSHAEVSS